METWIQTTLALSPVTGLPTLYRTPVQPIRITSRHWDSDICRITMSEPIWAAAFCGRLLRKAHSRVNRAGLSAPPFLFLEARWAIIAFITGLSFQAATRTKLSDAECYKLIALLRLCRFLSKSGEFA